MIMMTTSSSDTESADINAASTATTATTAAVSEQQPAKESNNGKKSKGLVLFNAIFKRVHEKYGEKRRAESNEAEQQAQDVGDQQQQQHSTTNVHIEQTPGQTHIADIEHNKTNKNKEDKQLVYAELILKPAAVAHGEDEALPITTTTTPTITAKNATEYAEIVYVQKPNAELHKQPKQA